MTAFSTANIPSNVDTLEELAAWACSALAEVNGSEQIQTAAGSVEPVATVQTFNFVAEDTNPERLVCVLYLPLSQDWRSQGKIWSNGINEISATALPAGYTAN